MNSLDMLGAIALTAGAATVIAVLGVSYLRTGASLGIVVAHASWFGLIVGLGMAGTFDYRLGAGTPGLGVAVLLPVLGLLCAATQSPRLRSILRSIPITTMIGVNAMRVLGVFFVMLYAAGRLPAPFAPIAGWGDVLIGSTALPVVWIVASRARNWRFVTLLWNALGVLDLCVAIGLGVVSAEGSPIRVFSGEPGTGIMTGLPWILIPAFLVPSLMLTHLAIYYRLATPVRPAHVAHA